jgi:U3 small nucleolar RNA-associated protein 19
MPTKPLGIHSFWIAELSKPPASSDPKRRNKVQKDPSEEQNAEVEEASEDDWRAYFDDPPPVPEETASSSHQPRTYKLSVLESLHSLPSHRVQFSSCWLTLLPHLSSSETLSSRALSVLHIGVMPHLVKPERLMDWVAGCVDFGQRLETRLIP